VVVKEFLVGQLKGTRGKIVDVGDAGVWGVRREAGAARNQELVVIGRQTIFGSFGKTDAVVGDVGILRAAYERSGQDIAAEIKLRRAHQKRIAARELEQSERSQSDAQAVHRVCSKTLQGHASSC